MHFPFSMDAPAAAPRSHGLGGTAQTHGAPPAQPSPKGPNDVWQLENGYHLWYDGKSDLFI